MLFRSLLLISASLVATTAFGADPFEGTWRGDAQKAVLSQKPFRMELLNGRYKCVDCDGPQIDVKADGTDQKVSGSLTFDTISVKATDGRTVECSYKIGGKLVRIEKSAVSKDGNHLTIESKFFPKNNIPPFTFTVANSRVEKGPAGSHAISGEWKADKVTSISESFMTFVFESTSNGMTMTQPGAGISSAKFDGKDYPIGAGTGVDSVSLRRIDAHTIEETDKEDGKIIEVDRFTISPDGHSIAVVSNDKVSGRTNKFALTKQ